jgi:hypothetical protein
MNLKNMNNTDKQYTDLLQDICKNHKKMSKDELDIKIKEYYKAIPSNLMVSSKRLDEIIMSRFEEGTHWKRYIITNE